MVTDSGAQQRVVWALRRAFLTVEAAKEQRLRATGLLGAHYGVLMNVSASPGLTGAELARRLCVTPQNIAGLVAKLADRGLVERRHHALHSHVLELHLTDDGTAVLRAADDAVAGLERAVVDLLGSERADVVRAGLDVLATRLDTQAP